MFEKQSGKTVIKVCHVTKRLGGTEVLRDVNFSCREGKICGIIGHNGSGKTVLFKCISGLYRPEEGEIYVRKKRLEEEMPQGMGIIIDSPAFLPGKSGMQNLELLYLLNHRRDRSHLEEIMRKVGLDPVSRKHVKYYSLGMRQRLAIAQAIMEDPDILILDEPMNGLDRNGIREIRELLLEWKARGKTILLASHNREDIELLCDEVYEMEMGRLEPEKVSQA
ncbi:MAG: ATP-binding cassette domain-containing protein [Eubacteriales bacterium]|nr:ATP-binding cassette domain-containing protein [Eubacteriales bacterium]